MHDRMCKSRWNTCMALTHGNVDMSALMSRGTGRQASLMWSNLAGFWGIGMPACYLLTFKYGLGVEGLWIGLLTGVSCSCERFEPHYARLATAQIVSNPKIMSSRISWFCIRKYRFSRSFHQMRCPPTLASPWHKLHPICRTRLETETA